MAQQAQQQVVITTGNTAALTLGIIAIVMGVLALTFGWIPFLGLLSIPVSVIGGALAGVGLFCCLFRGGARATVMPLLGAAICVTALVIPILSTGSASVALTTPPGGMDSAAASARAQAEDQAKKDYIANGIRLYEFFAKRGGTAGRAEVRFKLQNTGDRSLDRVEVTVYFLAAGGKRIAEDEFYPVLVTDSMFNDGKPLKPGYVIEEGGTWAEVPSEWVDGAISYAVTDIRFSE